MGTVVVLVVVLVVVVAARGTALVVGEVVDVVDTVVDTMVDTVVDTVVDTEVGASGAEEELKVSIGSLRAVESEQEQQAAISASPTIGATDLCRRSSRMVNRFTPTSR